jgi:hypothetical protein
MTNTIYVPARGQRIPMPGNQADWPQDGQPVNPIDGYQARLVRDGDLVVKPDDLPTPEAEAVTEIPAVIDPPRDPETVDPEKLTGKVTGRAQKTARGGE